MQNVTVEEIAIHTDARGLVMEPLAANQLPIQRNCHAVITQPGSVRGNHFHERGTEISVVLGPALVRIRENDRIRDINVEADKVVRFIFPPRVSHAFKNTGAAPMLTIAFNTTAFDPAQPDVVPDVLM